MTGVLLVGLLALVPTSRPASATAAGTDVTYTTSDDFAKGTLVNVNSTDVPDQLQLNRRSGTFPFIWIALSDRETIAKIDTTTGTVLGEYRAMSEGDGTHATSRTTVMLDGSVWVGHRFISQVTHVGLNELNQCVDRNHDGRIETSTGYGDVLAWPGTGSDVTQAADECILQSVDTPGSDSRHMSVDATGKVWVGDYAGGHAFVLLDGATGAFVHGTATTPYRTFSCGGYGGLVDRNGVLWSSNGGGYGLLRWNPAAPDADGVNPRCINVPVYGLAVDRDGNVWANEYGSHVRKVAPDGTVVGTFSNGQASSQGLAADADGDIWISSSLNCSAGCSVAHLKNDGTLVGNVATPTGSGTTGIAVDAAGKVWGAAINSSSAVRIDPALGEIGADGVTHIGAVDVTVDFPASSVNDVSLPRANPYNYSDMTGSVALGSTSRQGSWTVVQDGGEEGTTWHTIGVTADVPSGAQVTLVAEARAAATEAGLGSETYRAVPSCAPIEGLVGRFVQVRVTLRANDAGESPVVKDVLIRGGAGTPGNCSHGGTSTGGGGGPVAATSQTTVAPLPRHHTVLAGANWLGSAVAISQDDFADHPRALQTASRRYAAGTRTAMAVVLANGTSFADALAGGPLAVARTAPLLLTQAASLDPAVEAEIDRVLAPGGTVFVLGGPAAVSDAVVNRLGALGFHVVRLGGADRYETALVVARDGLGSPDTILVATGRNFPDGLSAGAAAGHVGGAVVLSDDGRLSSAVAAFLAGRTVYAVGGPAAAAVPSATPIVGVDRYDTSAKLASKLFGDVTSVALATGVRFQDALAGSAHIARRHAPLLLTDPVTLQASTGEYLRAHRATIGDYFVYGGPEAVTPGIAEQVDSALNG